MKVNLALAAIILSSIAIALSLGQPTYNFLMTMNKTESGKPSFSISQFGFYVYPTFTYIALTNNGTAIAHDVKLLLIFTNPPSQNWEATEFLSEIDKDESASLEIPIGYYQLNSTISSGLGFTDVTKYEAYIHISCRELDTTTTFHFTHFIP